MTRHALLGSTSTLLVSLISCGYHVAGKADLVPKSIQTISIPAFTSLSVHYTLTDLLPRDMAREFMARTRFRIESNPAEADAVLHGSINAVLLGPNVFDPTSGKPTTLGMTVVLTVSLIERKTGRVLYSRPNFTTIEHYEMAVDPHQLFDESGPAFQRLSRDVARDVVTGILENF